MRSEPPTRDHITGTTGCWLVLGERLRRLRESAGLSRADAALALRASPGKISRLENGRSAIKLRDVLDLLDLYGVTEVADREILFALARQAQATPWWDEYRDVVPEWFEDYLGLEQCARIIRAWHPLFVPGLLQTSDYARTVIRHGHPSGSPESIERRVTLRMERQTILMPPSTVKLWAVIGEAALRRVIGSTAIMRAQIDHLIDVAERSEITIQILPLSQWRVEAERPITVLRMAADIVPDVAYSEQLNTGVYYSREADTARCWDILNRLSVEACQPESTPDVLRKLSRQLQLG